MLTMTKRNIKKIQLMQRRIERSMLGITLGNKVPNDTSRGRTGLGDANKPQIR